MGQSKSDQGMANSYLKYIRVSTTQQEEQGYGPDVQDAGINSYAARHNLRVIDPPIIDDVSGDTFQREGLDQVKAILKAGKAKGVILYRPDRLARKTWIGLQALEELHGAGAEVHFENLGMIQNTPEARLQVSVLLSVGEYDKAQILTKLKAGKREKIATHKRPLNQGHAPYGYRFVGSKRTSAMEIVEEEAAVIRLIFQLHRELRSVTAVLDVLSEQRVPTYEDVRGRKRKDGAPTKQRGFGQWGHDSVYKILKHPVYKGRFPYYRSYNTFNEDGKRVQRLRALDDPAIVWVDVPAIVSESEWDQSQKIIRENDNRGASNRHGEYLLSRRMKCGVCGSNVSGKIFRGMDKGLGHRIKSLFYYVCNTKNFKEGRRLRKCTMPMFRREPVEATVWSYVEQQLLDPDKLEVGLRTLQANREEERRRLQAQKESLQQKLDTIKLQREKLISLYMNGMFTMEEIGVQKNHLDTQQQSFQEGLEETEALLDKEDATEYEIQQLRDFADLIRRKLDVSKFEHRQRILALLGVKVEMHREDDGTKFVTVTTHLSPAVAEKLLLISPNQAAS